MRLQTVFGIHHHGAQLPDAEHPAVPANALLHEEGIAPVASHQKRHQQDQGQGHGRSQQDQQGFENPLDTAAVKAPVSAIVGKAHIRQDEVGLEVGHGRIDRQNSLHRGKNHETNAPRADRREFQNRHGLIQQRPDRESAIPGEQTEASMALRGSE